MPGVAELRARETLPCSDWPDTASESSGGLSIDPPSQGVENRLEVAQRRRTDSIGGAASEDRSAEVATRRCGAPVPGTASAGLTGKALLFLFCPTSLVQQDNALS